MKKIAFIGAGNMASAIVGGIISSELSSPNDIILFDKNEQQYSKFNENCNKAKDIFSAIEFADYIFLSVKPQNLNDVLCEIKLKENYKQKVFVSICAGIKMSSIEAHLGEVKIARAMPNTPLLISQGTTGICRNLQISDEEFNFVKSIFSSSGYVVAVNEDDINNVTALTGSSPAYVYLFIKSMVDSAKKLGFDNENAVKMACNTVIGSANMILDSDKDIAELIRMVTSPKGTTEKALEVFYSNDFSGIIHKAMTACSERADELSNLN